MIGTYIKETVTFQMNNFMVNNINNNRNENYLSLF